MERAVSYTCIEGIRATGDKCEHRIRKHDGELTRPDFLVRLVVVVSVVAGTGSAIAAILVVAGFLTYGLVDSVW